MNMDPLKNTPVHDATVMFLDKTFNKYPKIFTALFVVAIIVAIIAIIFAFDFRDKYEKCEAKSTMCGGPGIRSYNNLTMGGALPLWELGSMSDQPYFATQPSSEDIRNTWAALENSSLRQTAAEQPHAHQGCYDPYADAAYKAGCKWLTGAIDDLEAAAVLGSVDYLSTGTGSSALNSQLSFGDANKQTYGDDYLASLFSQ
jgi:hypothetical protein